VPSSNRRQSPSQQLTSHAPTTRALRLLLVHPSADMYGSDRMALATLRAAREAGWETLTATPVPGPFSDQLAAEQFRHVLIPSPVLRKSSLSPRGVVRLAVSALISTQPQLRLLRTYRPDLILVNTITIPIWLLTARACRGALVCHAHEAETALSRPLQRLLTLPLVLADAIVCNSAATKDFITRAHAGLASRCVVVANGVPTRHGEGIELSVLTLENLALVGRLSPRKGQDVAIQALAQLVRQGRDVHLHLVGDCFPGYEWYESELRAMADQLAVDQRVSFHGYLSDPSVIYDTCGIALVPSRVEPFGNVALEAMAVGRPVIASRVQGLADLVLDGDNGLLVEPGDSAALSRAISRLIEDPALAAKLASDGRTFVREGFSEEAYSARITTALMDALTGRIASVNRYGISHRSRR